MPLSGPLLPTRYADEPDDGLDPYQGLECVSCGEPSHMGWFLGDAHYHLPCGGPEAAAILAMEHPPANEKIRAEATKLLAAFLKFYGEKTP